MSDLENRSPYERRSIERWADTMIASGQRTGTRDEVIAEGLKITEVSKPQGWNNS